MSGIKNMNFPENTIVPFTNSTGSTLLKDRLVRTGSRVGRVMSDAVNGATGLLDTAGRVTFAKATGFTLAAGGSFDLSSTGTAVLPGTGICHGGRAVNAVGTDDTTFLADINVPPLSIQVVLTPSAGQDSANTMDYDTGVGLAPRFWIVQVRDTNGLERAGTTVTALSGGDLGKIRVANANLAATDKVYIFAQW